MIVEKITRTLPNKSDHIVVAIEESKNVNNMMIEELQSSLEAHEIRITESFAIGTVYKALREHVSRRGGDEKW